MDITVGHSLVSFSALTSPFTHATTTSDTEAIPHPLTRPGQTRPLPHPTHHHITTTLPHPTTSPPQPNLSTHTSTVSGRCKETKKEPTPVLPRTTQEQPSPRPPSRYSPCLPSTSIPGHHLTMSLLGRLCAFSVSPRDPCRGPFSGRGCKMISQRRCEC